MHLTNHATQRRIQRNLPIDVLSTIYSFGAMAHSKGAVSLMLDEQSIMLATEGDRQRRAHLERYRGAYIIVGEGERVVTVARRRRRLRR